MNDSEIRFAILSEISAMQDFLSVRKTEISKQNTIVESAINRFFERNARSRANNRLVSFLAGLGYVPLDACGAANDSIDNRKRDWRGDIARTIAKHPSELLPLMQSLYEGRGQENPVEVTVQNPAIKTLVGSFLDKLAHAGFLFSFAKTPSGFSVVLSSDLRSRAKRLSKSVCEKRLWLRSGWAEKAFLYLAEKTFRSFSTERKIPVDFYWNVSVSDRPPYSIPSTEFDILVWLGNKWYVFESKAGTNLGVVRWVDRWHLFGEDRPDRIATIIQCTIQNFPTEVFSPLHLFPLSSFEDSLRALLEEDFRHAAT